MRSNIIKFPSSEIRQAMKLQKDWETVVATMKSYATGYQIEKPTDAERQKRVMEKQMSFGERYGRIPDKYHTSKLLDERND